MSQIDEIRAKHHAIDLDAPEPSLGPYCLADFEPWPCDTAVALAEVDRLRECLTSARKEIGMLRDELDRLEAEIKLAVHEGYYGVEQGHSDTDTLDAVMVALAAW
jgi:hypothetical protein